MISNVVYESGLTVAERARLVEWLTSTKNSFLEKIPKESEWESFFDFFVELARSVRVNKVSFAKDFVKTYHLAADNFTRHDGERYDESTHGIMNISILGIVDCLLANNLISDLFAEEITQCEAAERVAVFAKNN